MSAVAYVDGAYVPLRAARVSILDRGLQFADSIYEVWAVRGGRLRDEAGHFARLQRSLDELRISAPMSEAALGAVIRETMRRNRARDGIVYLQITRGQAARDHVFPSPSVPPTIIVTAKNLNQAAIAARAAEGVKVISLPETRWARRDIKSTNLLPNVLARQAAREADAFEAWFVDPEGLVTEGTSSNAWIVDAEGRLRTRGLSHDLLHGVTRAALTEAARRLGIEVIEEAFAINEARAAREAFISAASNPATPVIAIDGVRVGDGRPGPVTLRLRGEYLARG
ncbi:MAG TPA: D-amino acid aminotransferase [Hyphomonadaceae bacterium]|nr:D-amino acid aminotransferase [Hyphomonadaceae bacterium]